MKKFKNFLLDIFLILQIALMFVLLFYNWTYNLNMENIPVDSNIYTIYQKFVKEQDSNNEYTNIYKSTPTKIAIKHYDDVHTVMYDDIDLDDIYNNFNFANILKDISIEPINQATYNDVLNQNEFVFFEFLTPLSAILNIDSDLYVSNLILTTDAIYIKSYNDYYIYNYTSVIPQFEQYNNKYYFDDNVSCPYNLISNNVSYGNKIITESIYLNSSLEQEIIEEFLYNSDLVEKYNTYVGSLTQSVFINEYSKITLSSQSLEFETMESRGNLYYNDENLTTNEMIYIAVELFNNIQSNLGSSLGGYPLETYSLDGQTVVILGAKINNIPYYYEDYAGYFILNNSGLSYAKINLKKVDILEDVYKIEPSSFIIDTAPENANLELIYKNDTLLWVFKQIKEN